MLQAFGSVLVDLWQFFFDSIFRQNVYSNTDTPSPEPKVPEKQTAPILRNQVTSVDEVTSYSGQAAYVTVDSAPYFSVPAVAFDTKLGSLKYGDKVSVSQIQGGFASVEMEGTNVWVEADALEDNPQNIFPDLEPAHIYSENNENTLRLRSIIKDDLLGEQLNMPLQSAEYIFYKLNQLKTKVQWPPRRPRAVGSWSSILRGVKGVTMSIEPRTGSILEYSGDGSAGFLGYVDSVRPDHSIVLQSVGRKIEGEYLEEEFTHDEWKEWRPVFISFS